MESSCEGGCKLLLGTTEKIRIKKAHPKNSIAGRYLISLTELINERIFKIRNSIPHLVYR